MIILLQGDSREVLKTLPEGSVQCCVTSPPYFGLRDYGVAGQIGLEQTPDEYVAQLVAVFREVRRVLKKEGTLWLNLGDSYAGSGKGPSGNFSKDKGADKARNMWESERAQHTSALVPEGLKPKDLIGIPWRVAFALQADGWYLRQDIIWHKPNPMPESVKDRCTKSHEYIFLLSKSERYYFDQESILEDCSPGTHARLSQDVQNQIGSDRVPGKTNGNMKAVGRKSWKGSEFHTGKTGEHQLGRAQFNRKYDPGAGNKNNPSFDAAMSIMPEKRNKRSVWIVNTAPYKGAHFATFPPALVAPMILAGCPAGGMVLDPFGGSGTTGEVSESLGRNSILIELNPVYIELQKKRTAQMGLGL